MPGLIAGQHVAGLPPSLYGLPWQLCLGGPIDGFRGAFDIGVHVCTYLGREVSACLMHTMEVYKYILPRSSFSGIPSAYITHAFDFEK